MKNILVINAGSSSLKYQLMNDKMEVLAKGICERIGGAGSQMTYKAKGKKIETLSPMKDHVDAVKLVIAALLDKENGVVSSMDEIAAVGHRVVHGGETFSGSVLIDDAVMQSLTDNIPLAPLHNPANIMGIEACKKIMPTAPMVAVFDTAFHQTMPPQAYIYGVPYEDYIGLKVRRYGFHGTSHFYVSGQAAQKLGKPIEDLKIITCHLGNGSSVAAVKNGKCVDTSMGLTPLEGLVMGTRCGSIDPAIVFYLAERKGMTLKELDNYLNKKSGLMGVSGVSSDFRDIDDAVAAGNQRAKIARDVFCYGVKKYIGSYAAAMNGVDVVVFTAGAGENDRVVREAICRDMEFLGIEFDKEANESCPRGEAALLTKPGSKVQVWVIPTDEELVIAMDTLRLACK